MTHARKLQIFIVALVVAVSGGVAYAAFSNQTSNSGNSFSAAASFGSKLRMASGTYEGDGNANRAITGLGFQPDVVIVKGNAGSEAFMRTATMGAGLSKRLVGGNSAETGHIQSFESDGFTIGSNNRVNQNGSNFYWTAFKSGDGILKVGSYTGNGTSQSIAGLGFSPEYVIVADDNNERAVEHFAGSSSSFRFDADPGLTTRVTSLNADGFSVGSDNTTNRAARTFHYVAFNQVPGSVKVGTYTGNGTAGRSVTGVGFSPEYVNIRATTSQTGQHRSIRNTGNESMYFQGNTNLTTGITALQGDGFQLGTHASVNGNTTPYQYVAFDNTAGGCSEPTTGQILVAANDTWLDEANPAANNGSATTLRVRSQSGGQNQRALVDFDLPSVPAGCTVTAADLYLNASAPTAGRTLTVHRNASAWSEGGASWSDQPATVGAPATATTVGTAGWFSWNVKQLVSDQYSSGNYGFRVADQTEGASPGVTQVYGAREGGNTPPVLLLSIGN